MVGTYEFCVAGRLSDDLLRSFDPYDVRTTADRTVFCAVVGDDAELFGIIGRIEGLRLTLVSLHRLAEGGRSQPTRCCERQPRRRPRA